MPCFSPLKAWRSRIPTKAGKYPPVFDVKYGYEDRPLSLPCGQCIGCRLEYSRQWAIRCMHEASLHEDNCFVTLTYSDEHIPVTGSLDKSTLQRFLKRLRRSVSPARFRLFSCGEYGDNFGRPHYHVLLFGLDFADKRFFKRTPAGHRLFTSEFLDERWGLGSCYVGDVTFDSAAYVARYVVKKIKGDAAYEHYRSWNLVTGEEVQIEPEFSTKSNRGGIGRGWYDQFKDGVYRNDSVIVNGHEVKPPRFYDGLFEMDCRESYMAVRARRIREAQCDDNTPSRLKVREKVATAKLGLFTRRS
ncbi:replication initiator protein [Microviridae sp.]|nr:replication initiator protein [Microviridae sp.]